MGNDVIEDGLRTLSVRQLAEAMNLPTWRIYEMIRNAEAPPHFRIGKTYRFRVKSVDEWIGEQSNQKEKV
jgi:excisionase family DNA binding protein